MDKEEHRDKNVTRLICFHWGNRLFSPGQRNPSCRLLFSFLLCPTVPTAIKIQLEIYVNHQYTSNSRHDWQNQNELALKVKGTEVPATQSKQYFLT
jgi:hypothetical protein